MTPEEIKAAYFELLQVSLNNFKDKILEESPGPIKLAIEKLLEYDTRDATVSSEGISDLKQSFFEIEGMPSDVKNLISPYRNVRW